MRRPRRVPLALTSAQKAAILYRVVNNQLDRVYAAISDPTRRRMLARLSHGPLSVSELGRPLGMTLAGVGKHVAVLETAGLVFTHKSGRVRTCELRGEPYVEASAWIDEQRAFWQTRLERVAAHLAGAELQEES
ncbi:MAG: metalloregulator ArsR/SmtB family transcription factor [Pseudolysinimonas sp.]